MDEWNEYMDEWNECVNKQKISRLVNVIHIQDQNKSSAFLEAD